MMVEELQEFELLWPDNNKMCAAATAAAAITAVTAATKESNKRRDSTPINIAGSRLKTNGMSDEDDDDDRESEFVPPHILLARRFSDRMAYSLCTGNGRTLKGRDLRSVRNSILKMTGFLER